MRGDGMFGFVVANPEKLTEEQKKRYSGIYCGLCDDLGESRGFMCRMALTYDLVFLAVVLSSVFSEEYTESEGRCAVHPMKRKIRLRNKYTEYAADMNLALAYYKYLDDYSDDNSKKAYLKMKLFRKVSGEIAEKYPRQCEAVKNCLSELTKAEKENVLIPDIPSDIFGRLLGEIFAVGDENIRQSLYSFGEALGRFIYIADAAVDLKHDIKKQRYNPLVQMSFGDTEPLLQMLMADCVEKYKTLPIIQDREIIENILFSGIWTQYDARKKGKKQ